MHEKHLHLIRGPVTVATEYMNIVCYNPAAAMIHWFIMRSNSSMGRALASPERSPLKRAFVFYPKIPLP